MDTAQWPQEIVVKQMEEILIPINTTTTTTSCSNSNANSANHEKSLSLERKMKPHQNTQLVNCPRCNSTNTKFCYYNNYSLSQPRYFCKGCRRYWTEGGTLRNIPVGGGSRKNKKTTSSKKINPSLVLPQLPITTITATTDNNAISSTYENQGKDLNLGYDFETISRLIQVPSFESIDNKSRLSALELFNGDSNNSYMPMPIHNENNGSLYSEGFSSLPTLSFSLDGIGNSGSNGRVMFPFEDLKQVSSTNDHTRDQQGDSTGYWNGVLGGGSW